MIAGQLEIQLLANIARLQQDMDKATGLVSGAMGKIDKAAGIARTALGALGVTLSVNAFAKMIQGSIDAQDELLKMSQKVGISVEQLAGLEFAADQSGVSMTGLQTSLKTLSTQAVENAAEFKLLGISVKDANGNFKASDQLMLEVADRFSAVRDGVEKTEVATKLFGRTGLDLIPMLNGGSAAIREMIEEGQRLNPVTEESARQAEQYNDNIDKMKTTMGGFVTLISQSALPTLTSWTEKMVDLLTVTTEGMDAQDKWLAEIGTKTAPMLAKEVMARQEAIDGLEDQIAAYVRYGALDSQIQPLRAELALQVSAQRVLTAQLAKLRDGYEPVIAATSELAAESGELAASFDDLSNAAKAVITDAQFLDSLYRSNIGTIREVEQSYIDLMDASGATVPALVEDVDDLRAVLNDTGYSYGVLGDKSAEVTDAMVRDWQAVSHSAGEFFADLVLDGDNALDALLKSWQRAALQMAGTKLFNLGASALGINVPGVGGSGATGLLSTALGSSGFLSGIVGTAPVAGMSAATAAALNLPATAATGTGILGMTGGAGAGLMSTVGAAVPWIAAAYALYSIFSKDSTPSHNAGFLLNAVPGAKADQMFNVDPFESGVAPVGFSRRTDQSETLAVINAFRDDDARITRLLRGINPGFSVSSMNLTGYDERGLGNGRFIGSAWEEGMPGTALDVQRDSYARQLIAQAASFLDGEVLNRVLGAGNTDAMIRELEDAIGMTEKVAAATEVQTETLDALAGALDSLNSSATAAGTAVVSAASMLAGASTLGTQTGYAATLGAGPQAAGTHYVDGKLYDYQTPYERRVARMEAAAMPNPPSPSNATPAIAATLQNLTIAMNQVVANTGGTLRALDDVTRGNQTINTVSV